MPHSSLAIIGGGGFAREVAEIAGLCGYRIVACYSVDPGSYTSIHRGYLDELAAESSLYQGVVLGIGATDRASLKRRKTMIEWLKAHEIVCPPIISPHSIVSQDVTVGLGAIVAHGAILSRGAVLSPFSVVNSGAIIGHDASIGTNTIIAPGAFLGGTSLIHDDTLIGPLAKVLQGVSVGNDVILGVGCTALRALKDGATVWPKPDRVL